MHKLKQRIFFPNVTSYERVLSLIYSCPSPSVKGSRTHFAVVFSEHHIEKVGEVMRN